jgi:peptidoglycan/LPS O-acetylase OafA/YrhL
MGEAAIRNSSRNYSYNALRGLFAVGILFSHMSYLGASDSGFWQFVYSYIMRHGSVCTSFFYITAGFLACYAWKKMNLRKYAGRKLKRLYPLALGVFLLALLLDVLMGGSGVINKDMAAGSVRYFLSVLLNLTMLKAFVPQESIFYSFHGPSWFLSALVVFYLIAFYLIPAVKANRRYLHLTCGICALAYAAEFAICVFAAGKNNSLWLCYINPFFRIFGECFLGIILYMYMPRLTALIRGKSAAEILAAVFAVVFYVSISFTHTYLESALLQAVPVAVLLVAFNTDSGAVSRFLATRPMQKLGDISFELYMTHAFVYEGIPVAAGIVSLSVRDWVIGHPGTRFVMTLIASLIFAQITHWIMSRDRTPKKPEKALNSA